VNISDQMWSYYHSCKTIQ